MDKKIEDLKTHIKLLSDRRNLFNRIMDCLQEGILVLEKGDEILFYNHSFIKHLDLKVSNNLLNFEDLEKHQIFKNILKETRDMDFVNYSRDVELFSPWRKFLNIRAVCLERKAKNRTMVYIVQDATAIKQKQEETFNQKKLGAVLTLGAGFAHELGNPLNSMNIHIQIMKRFLEKESVLENELPQWSKELEIIESELTRMDHVIKSFLKATRPEKILFKEIDIVQTVKLSLESLSGMTGKQNIEVIFEPAFEKKFIFADSQKIQQAIINIGRNAVEAIEKDGVIHVSVKEEDGSIVIRIADNGPGISEEKVPKIFDPFFTTKESGVGLGLVISYKIIKEHDGDISVKSSPGKGTVFQLKLPLREFKLKFLEAKKNK